MKLILQRHYKKEYTKASEIDEMCVDEKDEMCVRHPYSQTKKTNNKLIKNPEAVKLG